MLTTVLITLITVGSALSDNNPVWRFPLNKQYGGRDILKDYPRINLDTTTFIDGPSGCEGGAIRKMNPVLKLNISNQKLSLNEPFSIFIYRRLPPSQNMYSAYVYKLLSNIEIVLTVHVHGHKIAMKGGGIIFEKYLNVNLSDWTHVGLTWNAQKRIANLWINGAAVLSGNFNFGPEVEISNIFVEQGLLTTLIDVTCLVIYDRVINANEVKSLMKSCKTCQVEKDCDIISRERTNCGYYGIGKRNCLKRGCCWDQCMKRGKRCFYDKAALPNSCDNVAPRNRMKCGKDHVLKQECEELNCCYDDTISRGPKCFNKPATQCEQEVENRVNCGFYGIGKRNCLRRRCCWDKTQKRGERCFYEKGAVTNECYNIAKGSRKKCGKSGIGMEECQRLNCCFDETVLNAIKCFVKPCN